MIGYLSGTPRITQTGVLLIVGGVGYAVMTPGRTQDRLRTQSQAELFIYTHVKEESLELFGFESEAEKQLFLLLLGVDGIGPKTALAVLENSVESILTAIRQANVSFFSSVPRVGKKSAQKILIELQTKVSGAVALDLQEPEGMEKDIVEALLSLGFQEHEARKAASQVADKTTLEEAVTAAIKLLTAKR